ncbi:hypothetical protein SCALM49S_02041 [Streptomyces californicus]
MVCTMAFLRALLRTARMVRHSSPLSAGPAADDAVLLDAPDERLSPALVAAALGDHEPAAKLLATTRDAADWENRDRYLDRLVAFARNRDGWLVDWLAAAPRDPDALLVKAELSVRRAWESPARAERLREVAPLITAAADADPRDPVPWRLALDHARGTHATHTAFESLWEQAVSASRRSRYSCHVAALRYLSAAWYGSHRECFDFAEQAAEDAPTRWCRPCRCGRPSRCSWTPRRRAGAPPSWRSGSTRRPTWRSGSPPPTGPATRGRRRCATSSRTCCSPGAAGRRHCAGST